MNKNDKGKQFLADCGFNASWLFKCSPQSNIEACVDNEYGGAWVPYPIMYRMAYKDCKFIKENAQGRQFSQDYNEAYK